MTAPTYMYPNSKVAPGRNNTGGLVAWESLIPSGDQRFFAPIIYGHYSPGLKAYDLTRLPFFRGFPEVLSGEFSLITQAQVWYIKNTLLSGSYGAWVTMELRTEDPSNYVYINTIFDLETMNNAKKTSKVFEHYPFVLAKIEVITL
jgi:hypothetical protein